jgi:hypothetical protein
VAAIAAAVISATSGIATYLSTQELIASQSRLADIEAERATNEFLRNERKEAYVQFMADEQLLRDAESAYYELAYERDPEGDGEPPPPTLAQLDAKRAAVSGQNLKFAQSASRVQIVGSPEATVLAANVRDAHARTVSIAIKEGESPNTPRQRLLQLNYERYSQDSRRLALEFINQARADVGT